MFNKTIVSLLLIVSIPITIGISSNIPIVSTIFHNHQTIAQPTTTKMPSNFLTYDNSTYGIKIQYPDNWQAKPANGFLGEVVFFSPQGVNQTRDQVELDISVIPSKNMSLDVLAQRQFEIYKTLLSNLEIAPSNPITFHGNQALMVLANSTNPISGIVKSTNIFTIKYGSLYIISYSAKPEIYSAYLSIAKKMIDSFQIIKRSTGNNNNLTKNITTLGNATENNNNNNTATTTLPLSSTSNFLTYENSTLGIRFEYPIDWKYYLSFASSSTPYSSIHEVRFNLLGSRLTISVRILPFFFQNASIQQLNKLVMDVFNVTSPYVKVLSSENATLSGYPGEKMVIVSSYPSQPKIIETNIFTIKNGAVYSVSFDGDVTYYNTFLPTAQKIIHSLRITK